MLINDVLTLSDVLINFDLMMAYIVHPAFSGLIAVNRLSTMSYAVPLIAPGGTEVELYRNKYYTQWRWYWYHAESCSWKLFGQVMLGMISSLFLFYCLAVGLDDIVYTGC